MDAEDPGYSDTDYESGDDDVPTSGDDFVCNESTDDDIGGPSSRSSRRSKGSRSNTNSPNPRKRSRPSASHKKDNKRRLLDIDEDDIFDVQCGSRPSSSKSRKRASKSSTPMPDRKKHAKKDAEPLTDDDYLKVCKPVEIVVDKNWMDKPVWCPFAKQLITFTLVPVGEAPQAASAVDVVTLEESPVKSDTMPSGSEKTAANPPTPTSETASGKPDSAATANDDGMSANLREILTEILATGSPQKSQQTAGTDKQPLSAAQGISDMMDTSAEDDDLQWSEGLLAIDEDADLITSSGAICEGSAPDALLVESGEEQPTAPVGQDHPTAVTACEEQTTAATADEEQITTDIDREEQTTSDTAGEEQTTTATVCEEQTTTATVDEGQTTADITGQDQTTDAIAGEEQTTTTAANVEEQTSTAIAEGKEQSTATIDGEEQTTITAASVEEPATIAEGAEQSIGTAAGEEQTTTTTANEDEQTTAVIAGEEQTTTSAASAEEPTTIAEGAEQSIGTAAGEKQTTATVGEEQATTATAGEEQATSTAASEKEPATIAEGEEQANPAGASEEQPAAAAAASVEPMSIDEQIAAEPLLPGYHPRFEDLELLDDLLEPEPSEDLNQSQNESSSREGSMEL